MTRRDVHEGAIVRILPHVEPPEWVEGATTREVVAAWPADDLLVAITVTERLVQVNSLKGKRQVCGGHWIQASGIVPRACVELVVPREHRWDLARGGHDSHDFAVWYQTLQGGTP